MASKITLVERQNLISVFVNGRQKGILLEEGYGWNATRSSGISKYFEDKDLAAAWIAQRTVTD